MTETRNPIPELLGALGLVVVGAVTALLKAQPSDEVAWIVILCACLLVIALAFAIYFIARRPREAIDLVFDERTLRRHYRAIRRATGSSRIEAIWSAKAYSNVNLYFARERRDLRRRARRLQIYRVIDKDVFAIDEFREALLDFVAHTPNHQPPQLATVPWFECYVCIHGSHTKAMFIINDTGQSTPEVGMFVDTERSPRVRPVAQTIRHWFERLEKDPLPDPTAATLPSTRRRLSLLILSLGRAVRDRSADARDRLRGNWPTLWRTHGFIRLAAALACVIGIAGISYSNPAASPPWIAELVLLYFIFDLGVRTHSYLSTPEPLTERIYGEGNLRQRYEEMRNTPNAFLIEAIWSADYQHTKHYFEEELRQLQEAPDLHVRRLVDERLLQDDALRAGLQGLMDDAPNLTVQATLSPEFECFLCHYRDASGNTQLKALFVFNNVRSRVPIVGLYVDPEKDPAREAIPQTIHEWFLALPRRDLDDVAPHHVLAADEAASSQGKSSSRHALDGRQGHDDAPEGENVNDPNIWELNARAYDQYVTDTVYPFLRTFLEREHELLLETIRQVVSAAGAASVIEVGSGTGRALLRLAETDVPWAALVGVDNAHEMIDVARENRENRSWPDDAVQPAFLCLDGTQLNDYFPAGAVDVDRLSSSAPRDEIELLHASQLAVTPRVICNLLNTLGVVDAINRRKLIRAMLRSAQSTDRLVISVFDAAAFSTEARGLYRRISAIVGGGMQAPNRIPDQAFDDERADFAYLTPDGRSQYYSHWFNGGELEQLLASEDCKIDQNHSISGFGHFIVFSRADGV